jgi:hypothetical protein
VYIAIVATLMLALPVACIVGEIFVCHEPLSLILVGKWFVIWSVGFRLVLAGLRQIIQPRYTAHVILSLKSEESLVLVRELGFANLAIGIIGLVSASRRRGALRERSRVESFMGWPAPITQ